MPSVRATLSIPKGVVVEFVKCPLTYSTTSSTLFGTTPKSQFDPPGGGTVFVMQCLRKGVKAPPSRTKSGTACVTLPNGVEIVCVGFDTWTGPLSERFAALLSCTVGVPEILTEPVTGKLPFVTLTSKGTGTNPPPASVLWLPTATRPETGTGFPAVLATFTFGVFTTVTGAAPAPVAFFCGTSDTADARITRPSVTAKALANRFIFFS